jgi:cell wall-associated NlpC family hydrolase
MPKRTYARDRWEYPRMPVVPARIRRRRFALTIALTAIFFAGAALAAGAGTQAAHPSDDSTVAVATGGTTTDTTATDAAETTDATSTDAGATTDEATTDAAVTADDATTVAAEPAVAPATPPAPTPADPAPAADPSDVVVKPVVPVNSNPVPAPAVQTAARTTAVHTKKKPPVRTLDRPLAIPYHAIIFDAQQWLNDNPGTPTGQAAVAIAMNYLGVPYTWGGAVPATGFDCSGLVRFVYAQLGINLVHYAASQFAAFPKLSPAQLQPGDLVFFEPKMDGPGHVGLYIGHDQMIEAPHTGAVVRITSVSGAAAQLGFLGAVRPYANQLLGALTTLSVVESRPAAVFARMQ